MFTLACTWCLFILPLPFVIWFWLPRVKTKLSAALKIPFYNELAAQIEQKEINPNKQKTLLSWFIIWALLTFGLAGPKWVGEPLPVEREGHNILLALDLSGSMEMTDMLLFGRPASRLSVVKRTASEFVKERQGDKMGLILFGTRAYLQTPLTYDKQNILMRIEDATAGLAGKTTSIGDAIGLAVKRLQKTPPKGRVLILLTDGVNNSGALDPIKAAEFAKLDNIKIYTIGLGAELDSASFGNIFMNVPSDLDEETLQEIARITGGEYFRANNVQNLQEIYKKINQLEKTRNEEETVRPQKQYYPWFVGLALLCVFLWLLLRIRPVRKTLPFKGKAYDY